MDFKLTSSAGGEHEIIINSQDKNLPHKLPGSQTDIVKGRFGSMHFHHFKSDDFSIWSSVYDIKETTTIEGRADQQVLELHGSVENQLHFTWDGIEQPAQWEDQYNMSYTPHVNNKVKFAAGKRYRTFDVHFTPQLLQEYSPYYPLLDKFLNKVENNKPSSLVKEDSLITSDMKKCIKGMADYYCHPGLAARFYDGKVKEFLMLMLHRVSDLHDKYNNKIIYTPSQIEAIHTARDFLVNNLANYPTIKELAKKVAMNECLLKKCFKHRFGNSIHQYFIHERMNGAKKLLLDPSLTLDDICMKLGYSEKQNFYNDFKKHFHLTPGQYCTEKNIKRK